MAIIPTGFLFLSSQSLAFPSLQTQIKSQYDIGTGATGRPEEHPGEFRVGEQVSHRRMVWRRIQNRVSA